MHTHRITSKIFAMLFLVAITACQTLPPPTPSPTAAVTQKTPTSAPSPTPQPKSTATPTPQPKPPTPVSAAPPAQVKGGTAILGLIGQPRSLNPITEYNTALKELSPLLFDSLLQVDPQTAQLQPGLAQSWRYSADGQKITFQLPPNLKWSDGTPLTAADVADSLQATQHPALLAFSEFAAPDDQTLTLTFVDIDCSAATAVALLPLIPALQILEPTPMGSGPFVVTDRSENLRTLSLAGNPNYHGSPPWLDGLTVRFIAQEAIEIALSEGQFDAVGPLPAGSNIPESFTAITYPAPEVIYIALNFDPRNEPSLAPRIRRALELALDRPAMMAEVLGGDGQLMAASLLPDHWAANHELSSPAYDPAAARALLAEAGLSDSDGDGWLDDNGERLEIAIRLNGANRLHRQLGWLAGSYYRELGLFARAESVPPDSLIDDLFTHDFRLAIFSWPVLPDPDQRLYWHSTENEEGAGLNFVSYNSPQMDKLLERGVNVTGCQSEDRAGSYAQMQKLLSEDRPVEFLLAPNQHILSTGRLQGLAPGPFAPFTWNITEWFLQK